MNKHEQTGDNHEIQEEIKSARKEAKDKITSTLEIPTPGDTEFEIDLGLERIDNRDLSEEEKKELRVNFLRNCFKITVENRNGEISKINSNRFEFFNYLMDKFKESVNDEKTEITELLKYIIKIDIDCFKRGEGKVLVLPASTCFNYFEDYLDQEIIDILFEASPRYFYYEMESFYKTGKIDDSKIKELIEIYGLSAYTKAELYGIKVKLTQEMFDKIFNSFYSEGFNFDAIKFLIKNIGLIRTEKQRIFLKENALKYTREFAGIGIEDIIEMVVKGEIDWISLDEIKETCLKRNKYDLILEYNNHFGLDISVNSDFFKKYWKYIKEDFESFKKEYYYSMKNFINNIIKYEISIDDNFLKDLLSFCKKSKYFEYKNLHGDDENEINSIIEKIYNFINIDNHKDLLFLYYNIFERYPKFREDIKNILNNNPEVFENPVFIKKIPSIIIGNNFLKQEIEDNLETILKTIDSMPEKTEQFKLYERLLSHFYDKVIEIKKDFSNEFIDYIFEILKKDKHLSFIDFYYDYGDKSKLNEELFIDLMNGFIKGQSKSSIEELKEYSDKFTLPSETKAKYGI